MVERNRPISQLNLSTRARNALYRNHIETVGQLLDLSPDNILHLRFIGAKSANELQEIIRQIKEDIDPFRESAPNAPLFWDDTPIIRRCPLDHKTPIYNLCLSSWMTNALCSHGCRTIEDLLHISAQDLSLLKGINSNQINKIIKMLLKLEKGEVPLTNYHR